MRTTTYLQYNAAGGGIRVSAPRQSSAPSRPWFQTIANTPAEEKTDARGGGDLRTGATGSPKVQITADNISDSSSEFVPISYNTKAVLHRPNSALLKHRKTNKREVHNSPTQIILPNGDVRIGSDFDPTPFVHLEEDNLDEDLYVNDTAIYSSPVDVQQTYALYLSYAACVLLSIDFGLHTYLIFTDVDGLKDVATSLLGSPEVYWMVSVLVIITGIVGAWTKETYIVSTFIPFYLTDAFIIMTSCATQIQTLTLFVMLFTAGTVIQLRQELMGFWYI